MNFRAHEKTFKERFEPILDNETLEFVLASFAYAPRYGIRSSRKRDPRIKHSKGYGVLTPLPHATMDILSSDYIKELFNGSDLDVEMAWLAIQRQYKVD